MSDWEIGVFYVSQGDAAARVRVVAAPRHPSLRERLDDVRVEVRIIGPVCRYASTLQAKIPLAVRRPAAWGKLPAAAAEGIVPDPCPWSSEMPFLYRAVGRIVDAGGNTTEFDQSFGIRPLGIVRRRIVFHEKPWVPRIVHRRSTSDDAPPEAWREADAVMFVDEFDDALLEAADAVGVRLAVRLAGDEVLGRLRQSAVHPSVTIVQLDDATLGDDDFRATAPNTLSMCRVKPGVRSAAQLATADVAADGALVPAVDRPTLARRRLDAPLPLVEARAACDRLQRDLAGRFDAAGYLV